MQICMNMQAVFLLQLAKILPGKRYWILDVALVETVSILLKKATLSQQAERSVYQLESFLQRKEESSMTLAYLTELYLVKNLGFSTKVICEVRLHQRCLDRECYED